MHDAIKKLKYAYSLFRKNLVYLNLQILYQCNFKCKICSFWTKEYKDMPKLTADSAKIISEKFRSTPLVVTIGGGEPMMHPELLEIVKALSENHFPTMICNGWFVTEEKARELWKAGLYEVSVSIDYADPSKHDKQRGAYGAFNRGIAALKTLNKTRVWPHQRVHMISVLTNDNHDDIEHLIRLADQIGITYVLTLYSYGRGRKKDIEPPQTDVSSHLLKLKKKYPNFVGAWGYLSRFNEALHSGVTPCYAGRNLFNIDCQGNVSRCIDRLDDAAGNILKDNVDHIKQALFTKHKSNDCADCWTTCRGNIESLLYGNGRLRSFYDLYEMTRKVPLLPSTEKYGRDNPVKHEV